MKKKILIISLICVFIIGCFVVFSVTNKKYNLFNKNKSTVTVDSTQFQTDQLAIDTIQIVDSLIVSKVDSSKIIKVDQIKKEVNKSDYWVKKTNYYIKNSNISKAKYSLKKLKKYSDNQELISSLAEKIKMIKVNSPSAENVSDNWVLKMQKDADTSYYVIHNKVSGTDLSNHYFNKKKAQIELENFKKILSK